MLYILSFFGGAIIMLLVLFFIAKLKIKKSEKIRKEKGNE